MGRRSAWAKAKYQMHPKRVLTRFMTGGRYNSPGAVGKALAKGAAKSVVAPLRTRTVKVTAKSRQAQVAAAKAPAKKAAAKRASAYEQALRIPGQNRTAAAKAAAGRKATAGGKSEPIRGKGGQFNGRTPALNPADQAAYERAMSGHVDPRLTPRTPRRR